MLHNRLIKLFDMFVQEWQAAKQAGSDHVLKQELLFYTDNILYSIIIKISTGEVVVEQQTVDDFRSIAHHIELLKKDIENDTLILAIDKLIEKIGGTDG